MSQQDNKPKTVPVQPGVIHIPIHMSNQKKNLRPGRAIAQRFYFAISRALKKPVSARHT
jgi:hypothetical protein